MAIEQHTILHLLERTISLRDNAAWKEIETIVKPIIGGMCVKKVPFEEFNKWFVSWLFASRKLESVYRTLKATYGTSKDADPEAILQHFKNYFTHIVTSGIGDFYREINYRPRRKTSTRHDKDGAEDPDAIRALRAIYRKPDFIDLSLTDMTTGEAQGFVEQKRLAKDGSIADILDEEACHQEENVRIENLPDILRVTYRLRCAPHTITDKDYAFIVQTTDKDPGKVKHTVDDMVKRGVKFTAKRVATILDTTPGNVDQRVSRARVLIYGKADGKADNKENQ